MKITSENSRMTSETVAAATGTYINGLLNWLANICNRPGWICLDNA